MQEEAIHHEVAKYYQAGDYERAGDLLKAHLSHTPNHPVLSCNYGVVLTAQGRYAQAICYFENAMTCAPEYVDPYYNLAQLYQTIEAYDEAATWYKKALSLQPTHPDAQANLGSVLQAQGDFDGAISVFEEILQTTPNDPRAYFNLGNAYRELQAFEKAAVAYRRALELKPHYPDASHNLGMTAFALKDYKTAWEGYESRWGSSGCVSAYRELDLPLWHGECLRDHSILLWAEQGVGDEIMLGRCISWVSHSAKRCVVECDPRLLPIYQRTWPSVQFIQRLSGIGALREIKADYHCPLGSLPRIFNWPVQREVTIFPYLRVDQASVERIKKRYQKALPKPRWIGCTWASANVRHGKERSIPLAAWAPLFARDDMIWMNCQHGDERNRFDEVSMGCAGYQFSDPAIDPLLDLDQYAAQLECLDCIITVDNTTAHLAGALNIPTYLCLPARSDWRWGLDEGPSLWYPSVTVIRQPSPGDWGSVIQELVKRL